MFETDDYYINSEFCDGGRLIDPHNIEIYKKKENGCMASISLLYIYTATVCLLVS